MRAGKFLLGKQPVLILLLLIIAHFNVLSQEYSFQKECKPDADVKIYIDTFYAKIKKDKKQHGLVDYIDICKPCYLLKPTDKKLTITKFIVWTDDSTSVYEYNVEGNNLTANSAAMAKIFSLPADDLIHFYCINAIDKQKNNVILKGFSIKKEILLNLRR